MADLELNSIDNGDGNNYLLRDNSKIPLSGSNQISGDLVPATTDSVNLGSSVKEYLNAYIKSLSINGVACGDILTHNASEFVPRSGGAVLGRLYTRTDNSSELILSGGLGWNKDATIVLHGTSVGGEVIFAPSNGTNTKYMYLHPNGTWTWNGTACQVTSDQRLKQQISEIDDKLLDAWQDVEPCQFKYNDAVKEKSDNARLHTGYVVQQIDEACKKHNVDISAYGLYCHEEYPEETEEVEVEQADGTKTKERKVIREASEHYSLRYTEALVVECAYLRRENDKLKQQFKQLEETVNELKSIINCSEFPNS